jgi:flagellar biosynthesis/type III secretory pathway chaperone
MSNVRLNRTMLNQSDVRTTAKALIACLQELHGLIHQLADVADLKLAAMRKADPPGLHACAERENKLLQQVGRYEQQRGALLARLAQLMRIKDLRRTPLSEVANLFPEPESSALRARNAGLRHIAEQLQHKNHLAAEVAQQLQQHIRAIFNDLAEHTQERVVYGSNGKLSGNDKPRLLVDALG